MGEVVREEKRSSSGIGECDPIVIEVTPGLRIENQVAVCCR
jgi:hypothetical protein